jgi:hypothetical protein
MLGDPFRHERALGDNAVVGVVAHMVECIAHEPPAEAVLALLADDLGVGEDDGVVGQRVRGVARELPSITSSKRSRSWFWMTSDTHQPYDQRPPARQTRAR